ncbi:type VI secretion system tip protein VgrG [Permianibacter sp. IMCC34836]|uniref:type VI secretion system tip protein VgrG n=1 Tax=Permianibacter fluminis TaxID=2738515 RepID=UPI001553ADCF|nr:type VI secretion system tip protein VgrG [Permianibacter fluminis]NQD38313.1 type VI secretion system tip protein VgrG [Permianibacter fluminis]
MADARTLPIAAEHREFTVKASGTAVGREHQLLALSVVKAVNTISALRLVYQDGAASSSDFPLSNTDLFAPGKEVEVLAGAGGDPVSLFKGIVIKQSLKVREQSSPQLVIECRHKASTLTVGRRNACYFDQKDSEVMEALATAAGLTAEVEASKVKHEQLVQYRSTDWDFLLTRAEANGKMVLTDADKLIVKAAAMSGSPKCSLQFGATVLEFDAEIDSRRQFAAVKGISWDPATQALVQCDGATPTVQGPGNYSEDSLAAVIGLDQFALHHAALAEDEAQAWADAQWQKVQISKVCGRIKCEGIGTVNPGDVVTVGGVGERFNGNVFVTGVRHEFDLVQGWKTHLQFGSQQHWFAEQHNVSAPQAGALLPSVSGLQIGVVISNEDPEGEHRVRVRLPMVDTDQDGIWARVASLDAGKERGFFFRPEIGDEVVLGFLEDDPRRAVMLGMLHSSSLPAPLEGKDDNHEKLFQSREKMKLYFNDEKKILQLETPAGNKLTLDEDEKVIRLADQHGNKIEMTADGIKIESIKAIELKAATDCKLESGLGFNVKGGTEMKLEGAVSAELSSAATTTIKGGILQLN